MSRLRLHIEDERGAVSFRTFVDILNRTRLILSELDVALSGQPRGALEWSVSDLGLGSANATIEALAPLDADERLPQLVSENFITGLSIVEESAELPAYFSELTLQRVGAISQRLNGNRPALLDATHLEVGSHARVTGRAHANVKEATRPRFAAIGSVIGRLGLVSTEKARWFNVYDELTHRAVRCHYEHAQFEEVRAALRKRVIVAGLVRRNAQGLPLRVENPRSSCPTKRSDPRRADSSASIRTSRAGSP